MANLATERSSPPAKSPHPLSAPGLAPLEYLQLTQRRGSITDPSLHASHHHQNPTGHQQQPDQSPPRHPLANSFTTHRSPSYSFPAKMPPQDAHHPHDHPQPPPARPWSSQDHPMDADPPPPPAGRASTGPADRNGSFLPPPPFAGGKRKMSHDRAGYYDDHPPNGNSAAGPYPNYPQDMDAPNPKRRGSTYDTNNRIAHLSLQDRRDSVDSRSSLSGLSMGGGNAWDRRDSVYSTTSLASSVGSYSTAGPGEGKPYWSSGSAQQPEGHPTAHHSSRPFAFPPDPVAGGQQQQQQQPPSQGYAMPPAPPIPSVHYGTSAALARRLSIPESSLPSNGLKPRTRAPRGSKTAAAASATTNAQSDERPATEGSNGTDSASPVADDAAANGGNGYGNNQNLQPPAPRKETPYSRSPELRVSHKMAERKRRKEMKDLFDELRDQLPADRGMKASKWEILSKAVDYISQLKVAYADMSTEIERLRGEVDGLRPGGAPSHPPVAYAHNLVSGPMAVPSNPGPGPASPASGHANGRGSDSHSDSGSGTESMRSPSAPAPKQEEARSPALTSHHQTPTPQQQAQALPQGSQ